MLIEILLVLCRKSPTKSAAIYKRAFQKCLYISLGAPGSRKFYTLPDCSNYIASSAVPGDPSLRFGKFQFFMPIGPSSWAGCTYPHFFPPHGFFSQLVRGDPDPAGRKVYEVEFLKEYDDIMIGNDVVCTVTGKVVGEILGICQENRVLVKMEESFVESDGWKLGTWQAA